jgi:hypothetical protein
MVGKNHVFSGLLTHIYHEFVRGNENPEVNAGFS